VAAAASTGRGRDEGFVSMSVWSVGVPGIDIARVADDAGHLGGHLVGGLDEAVPGDDADAEDAGDAAEDEGDDATGGEAR